MPRGDLAVDIGVKVGGAQAERAPDAHRRQLAGVDQAAHGARADREPLGGVLEGE
jgi:hypothetical protein